MNIPSSFQKPTSLCFSVPLLHLKLWGLLHFSSLRPNEWEMEQKAIEVSKWQTWRSRIRRQQWSYHVETDREPVGRDVMNKNYDTSQPITVISESFVANSLSLIPSWRLAHLFLSGTVKIAIFGTLKTGNKSNAFVLYTKTEAFLVARPISLSFSSWKFFHSLLFCGDICE